MARPEELLVDGAEEERVKNLLKAVADVVAAATEGGMKLNQALSLVAITAAAHGRAALGERYVHALCRTIQRRPRSAVREGKLGKSRAGRRVSAPRNTL